MVGLAGMGNMGQGQWPMAQTGYNAVQADAQVGYYSHPIMDPGLLPAAQQQLLPQGQIPSYYNPYGGSQPMQQPQYTRVFHT